MNTTPNATRMHPLMAAAAASVIIVSLTGAAAITGLLPTSHSAPDAQATPVAARLPAQPAPGQMVAGPQYPVAAQYAAAPAAPMLVGAAPGTAAYVQAPNVPAAPVVVARQEPAPVVRHVAAPKPRVIEHHTTKVVHVQEPSYRPAPEPVAPQPAPVPAQPHYVGIGTGAVIGGLIGNQVGGGNGKKLATLAGIIGGGYIGNEVAKRNSNGQ